MRRLIQETSPWLVGGLLAALLGCGDDARKGEHAAPPEPSPSESLVADAVAKSIAPKKALTVEQLRADPELQTSLYLLQKWIEARLPSRDIPGLSIAIAHDGDILWSEGFGYANRARKLEATPRTIYRLASITKLFTATAVMQLRDAGKLSLHDPVAKHLDWFRLRGVQATSHPVRIRHLLTHTSGLPREAGYPYWATAEFPDKEQLIATLAKQRAAFPPGVKWKYSNLGLSLAGEIVSVVSETEYADYVDKHIFEPLQMGDSSLGLPVDPQRFAVPYGPRLPGQPERVKRPSSPGNAVGPAVDLCSTVEDLVRFGMFHVRGSEAEQALLGLDPVTFGQMHRVHALSENWQFAHGLGFLVRRVDDTIIIGHGGAHIGFRSQLDISVSDKLVVAVASNADDVSATDFSEKALKLMLPHIRRLDAKPQPAKEIGGLDKYVGRYRNGWGDVLVVRTKGRLAATYIGGDDPEDT